MYHYHLSIKPIVVCEQKDLTRLIRQRGSPQPSANQIKSKPRSNQGIKSRVHNTNKHHGGTYPQRHGRPPRQRRRTSPRIRSHRRCLHHRRRRRRRHPRRRPIRIQRTRTLSHHSSFHRRLHRWDRTQTLSSEGGGARRENLQDHERLPGLSLGD